MKIKKIIKDKVKLDYLFIEGFLDIDSKYFIKEIDKAIQEQDNNNFKTNVQGFMTSWDYFNNNKKFLKSIYPLFDYLDSLDNIKPYELRSSWGLKEDFSHFTQPHDHLPNYLSAIIYLNNHQQMLIFPELQKTFKPKKNSFILFSSFLNHRTDRNLLDKNKYAISININHCGGKNVYK